MPTWKDIWSEVKAYAKELAQEFENDNVSSLSAALAYYATFSVVPALIITIAVGGQFFGEDTTRMRLLTELQLWMGPDALGFIERALEAASEESRSSSIWASVVSVVLIIVGGTRFFAELQEALNRVWEVKTKRRAFLETIRKRLFSFVLIALIGAVLITSMVGSTIVATVGQFAASLLPVNLGLVELLNTAVTFSVGTALFAMIFRFFPDVRVAWQDVWLGAAITMALMTGAKYLMGLYLARTAFTSTYGAAGSLLVFLFWIYISANIILMGAEFTQVHARRNGREITPDKRAERR